MTRVLSKYTLILLGVISLAVLIHFTVSINVAPTTPEAGTYDSIYYIVLVRDYWQGVISTPYRFESQMTSMSALYRSQIISAMPFGVTPTALLIWSPFAWLATFSIPLANTLWLTFSLGMLFFSWQQIAQYLMLRHRGRLALYGLVVYIAFFSATMYIAVLNVQTSILNCALFTLLIIETLRVRQCNAAPRRWLFYLLFFGLSIKITYLAIAALFLFAMEFRTDAILATVAVGAVTLLIAFWRGMGLLTDYMAQLSLYSNLVLPDYYATSFPLRMNNFTGAWRHILGWQLAALLSQVFFAVGTLMVMGISYVKTCSSAKWLRHFTYEHLGLLCFALFLLFMPHLGIYDELMLLVVSIIALTANTATFPDRFTFLTQPRILLDLGALVILLNFPAITPPSLLWVLWLLKGVYIGSLYYRVTPTYDGVAEVTPLPYVSP